MCAHKGLGVNEDAESLAREVARLHQEGRSARALSLAQRAAQRFPRSPLTHCNHGFLLVTAGNFEAACAAYERALALDPGHAEARRGLAVARAQRGTSVQGDSLSVMPYTGVAPAVEVLVPITLGSGNLVLDELFDSSVVRVTKLALELHPPGALPPHDVVFNAIGDADASPEALARLDALLTASNRRVLNPPSRVAVTGRAQQAQRLRGLSGVRTPRTVRIARDAAHGLPLPMLLRAPGYHAGAHFELVRTPGEVDAALGSFPGGDLFAIEFVNTRDAGGEFTKYRVVAVDRRLYPVHAAVARQWKVHYFSAEMATSAISRARESSFLADARAALGDRAYAALERVVEGTGLDYVGIDFALDASGEVVVFECNATMALRRPPQDPMWDYRRPAAAAVLDAVTRMLVRYSST